MMSFYQVKKIIVCKVVYVKFVVNNFMQLGTAVKGNQLKVINSFSLTASCFCSL